MKVCVVERERRTGRFEWVGGYRVDGCVFLFLSCVFGSVIHPPTNPPTHPIQAAWVARDFTPSHLSMSVLSPHERVEEEEEEVGGRGGGGGGGKEEEVGGRRKKTVLHIVHGEGLRLLLFVHKRREEEVSHPPTSQQEEEEEEEEETQSLTHSSIHSTGRGGGGGGEVLFGLGQICVGSEGGRTLVCGGGRRRR